MVNPSRKKGTAFETLVVDYFRRWFPNAIRHPLHGNVDLGDVYGIPGLCVSCKNTTRPQLSEWIKAVRQQADNAGAIFGVVVHKRVGKGNASEQFVTLTLADFVAMYARLAELDAAEHRQHDHEGRGV